jgi:hypothetical protein
MAAAGQKTPEERVAEARQTFESGAHVFQFSIEVMSQDGSTTFQTATDPNALLNSVCDQGWELVTGDFVFVQESQQQSRERFLSPGQNAAIRGRVFGYYLFKRSEANRRAAEDEARRRAQQERQSRWLEGEARFFQEPPPSAN